MTIHTLQLPLRGLASEGAHEIVTRALEHVPGVSAIRVSMAYSLLEIDYDEATTSEQSLHAALKTAGIVHGAHG